MCTTFFTVKEVEEMREEDLTLNQSDQRKYLKRAIRDARGSYSLHGIFDASKGWAQEDSTVFAQDWLESYFNLYGDRLPDRQEFSLPSCLTKTTIFEQYESEVGHSAGLPLVSRSMFHDIWTKHFPTVKIGKTGLIKQPDKRSRAEFIALRQEHLNLQAECRKKYYKHIRKASTDKMEGRHLSIIKDNMDQAKSRLPSFCTNSKFIYFLQTHITGTDAFRPDANITLNALVHVLSDLCKLPYQTGVFPLYW
ncbi:hypothetical protein DPMN_075665 [Dreissena polymorpha]|uniref:Uncharacterized protein n=1 Tax=Dreissena polymorpha TaxID=45954 RepID=A0A9D3YKR4_DREPO|nr:hypothetical protein DPMN_075665 [Dreissena polymorpha]